MGMFYLKKREIRERASRFSISNNTYYLITNPLNFGNQKIKILQTYPSTSSGDMTYTLKHNL